MTRTSSQSGRRSSRKATIQADYTVDKATMFVFYISIVSIIVEVLAHIGDLPQFSQQYAIFIGFEASIIVVTRTKMLRIVNPKEVPVNHWITIAWTSVVGVIGVFAIQVVVGLLTRVKLALAPWEIYLFYVNAALAEECLYRATLITFLDKLLVKMPFLVEQGLLRKLILIIASASLFGLSHYWVYGSQPALMLTAFLCGFVLALVYVIARNPIPNVAAHVINNLTAANMIVQSMSVVSLASAFSPVILPFTAFGWMAVAFILCGRYIARKHSPRKSMEVPMVV